MSWKVEKEFFLVMLVFCLNLSIHLAISGFPLPGIVGAQPASVERGWVLGHCRLGVGTSVITLREHRDPAQFRDSGLMPSCCSTLCALGHRTHPTWTPVSSCMT